MANEEWQEGEAAQAAPSYKGRVFRSTQGNAGRGSRGGGGGNRSSNGDPANRGGRNESNVADRSSRGRNNQANWRERRPSDNRRSESNRKVLDIPSHRIGRIIGKGGSKIRELETQSGVKIKIAKSNGITTDVTLIGSGQAIDEADSLIKEIVDEKQAPPSDDQFNASAEPSAMSEQPKEDREEVMDLDRIYAEGQAMYLKQFEGLPPTVKDFYKEDPKVAATCPSEVARWRRANNDIQVKRTSDENPDLRPIPNPVTTFEQAFQHYPEILQEIYKQGFTTPSPIQCQAWPILMRGEDMIGIAQTGTGKTLAFLLPALIHIEGQTAPRKQRPGPTVLIMTPTRELALQIDKEVSKYQYRDIKSACLYGGGNRDIQIEALSKGVDIVIATPGRFDDLVVTGKLNFTNLSYIVLDEADRMLDMGFENQMRNTLLDMRPDRQVIMTSATWPSGVRRLAQSYIKDAILVSVGSLDLAAVHTVTQRIEFVEDKDKEAALLDFLLKMKKTDKVIVFCGKKTTATDISMELANRGIQCQAIHGNREQSSREAALSALKDGLVNILIATDVASRGIDIEDLTHVINFDFPRYIEEYVHRIGRTGRAGKTGTAITYVSRRDWAHARELIRIMEEANQVVPDELHQMAKRFEKMKLRKEEGGGDGRGGRGDGGSGDGRGGRGDGGSGDGRGGRGGGGRGGRGRW